MLVWPLVGAAWGDSADKPDAVPSVAIGPPPAWVKPLDPDTVVVPKTINAENGVDYILVDRQQMMEPMADYVHYTRRMINEHGLEDGAEIKGDFDPSYQTFTMHALRIKRDGVWQDRLATEKYQVLRREENLDSQMLDGRYSVVYHLQDVRVGDEIDFSYTVTGGNPVFNGKYFNSFSTTWASPVHLFSNQLITAPNRTVTYKSFGPSIQPTETKASADQPGLLVWRQEEVPATFSEDQTPNWFDDYGWVQVSEFNSWKDVVDWGLATYPFSDPLSPELQAKIDEIGKAHPDARGRALAVLDLVQNDIRYLGVEMGANSYKPTTPSLVFQHRFGDCKDKSLFCVVMLRALGIEAYPALVDTDYRQKTSEMLPSPLAFDHAIVEMMVDGKTFWIDATRTGQRGRLEDFYVDDFKQALVLKPGVNALAPMSTSPDSLPRDVIEDTYTVKSVTDPVLFQVHSIYRGNSAESMRSTFAESSIDKVGKDYLDYYAEHFPRIKMEKPVRFQDFPEENRFEVWEEYSLTDFWSRETPTSRWKAIFSPFSVSDHMGTLPSSQRNAPYELDYPDNISENIEVRMFEDWPVDTKPSTVTTPYFTYSDSPSGDHNIVHFNYHYEALVPDVMPADMADYRAQLKKIKDDQDYNLTYLPPAPVVAAVASATGAPVAGSAPTAVSAPAAPAADPYRPNWMVFVIVAFVVGVSCDVAYRIYSGKRPYPPLPLPIELAPYNGIRGWLILVIIGLVYRSVIYLKEIVFGNAVVWDATAWNKLTVPGAEGYDPLWAPTLLFGLGGFIVFFVFSILALVLLFQKRSIFPRLMIFFFSAILIFTFVEIALAHQIGYLIKHPDSEVDSEAVKVVVQTVIWVPYFLVSKRVKATFRF